MLQINISGTGADETDYVIPLNIHRGPKSGDDTTDDVFMDNTCSEDFSDIRITDADGTQLDCYIHSHGNYEIIQDVVHLGEQNIITAGGKIVASRVQDVTVGIAESNDNGETWDILHPAAATIIWVDPITGHYFANDGDYFGGRLLMRSVDADHLVWNTVLDMTAETGSILPYGFCEDAAGTLFAGRYQLANNAAIFRSIDAGATWQKIYQGDGTKQHIHGLDIDPYTGYLYAGVDGVGAAKQLIRSTNASDVTVAAVDVVFTELVESDAVQMLFGDGWRLFTNETETFNDGIISTVYRTTDDAAFTSEILTGHCGRGITMIGSSIYMTTSAQHTQRYPQLLRRNDDGTWKTIWIANFDEAAGNYGPRMATPEGTPTGGEIQSLISPYSAGLGYAPMRLFDGGDHYQALVYIKIPSLPAAGCTICIHCGSGLGSTIETWSDSFSLPGLFTHYKFEEGAGTDSWNW